MTPAEEQATARAANQLAREKFKAKLMQEILFDLTVCKIEGWDTAQYTAEIKRLVDEAHRKITNPPRRRLYAPKPKQMAMWEANAEEGIG
jgi:hypothetical protein